MADPLTSAMREHLGVLLKDRWRWERALRSQSHRYLSLANRTERIESSPDGSGFACKWTYTSRLHAAMVQPQLGQRLLRRCLQDAPIGQANRPLWQGSDPEISVLIGHRGTERLPLLQATLASIAAQDDVRLECVVIEQDGTSQIGPHLPSWVRHVHAPLKDPEAPYNRSHTFNCGVREARSPVVLLHDNDMLIPRGYARRVLRHIASGYAVVNPKRFIFYLSERHSQAVLHGTASFDAEPADYIVQNLEAGGSMAITKSAFNAIGGMDESFRGWGGEDNEFWDRCLTLPTWIWGYEPIVHLWHRGQPLKGQQDNPNLERARALMGQPADARIAALLAGRADHLPRR